MLAAIGPEAEPAARAALASGGFHAKCCAALTLAHLGAKDAAEELAGLLPSTFQLPQETCHKTAPRLAMIQALGKLRDPRAIPALQVAMTRDVYGSNRGAAAHAVGEIGGDEAVRVLRQAYSDKYVPEVQSAALHSLVKILGPGAKSDVQALLRGKDRYMKSVAERLLDKVAGEEDVGQLRRMLKSPVATQRQAAARSLRNVKSPDTVSDLLAALRDRDPMVRRAASEAVSEMREPSAAPGLLEFIQSSKTSPGRDAALQSLARTDGDEAKAGMCELLLKHPEAELRLQVVRYLQSRVQSDPDIQTAFELAMVHDPDEKIRAKAKEAVSLAQLLERLQKNADQRRGAR